MMHDFTAAQLASLSLDRQKPLLICDVDEVVVHFTRDFEVFLDSRGYWLDPVSFALNGNIRARTTGSPAADSEVAALIDEYFAARTRHQVPIDGAVEAILRLARIASVVMLTNLPHKAREDRCRNLESHGLAFPVITNSGSKGPAIATLCRSVNGPVAFIDDSPASMTASNAHAPAVGLVHFMHDSRFARHAPSFDFAAHRAGNWVEAETLLLRLIDADGRRSG